MSCSRLAVFTLAAVVAAALLISAAEAALTADQRTKFRTADAAVKKAAILYRAKKYKEAGVAIKEAQDALGEIAKSDAAKDAAAELEPLLKQVTKAHELLELEGVTLPPLPQLPGKDAPSGGTPAATPAGAVSFTKQVAPILSNKCGRCHIMDSKGTFNMATFTSLMKGNKDGPVIMAGKGKSSRIVEVLDSGDMPRGGGQLTSDQIATIEKWIDEGAKFDGTDQNAQLTDFARTANNQRAKIEVGQASGNESVLFARDIGPVLVEHCTKCHGDRQPRGMLSMTSFDRLMRGGDSGPVLVPGKPAESLLVRKLKGQAGKRMPDREPPLADAVIAKFEAWIAGGAKFDGPAGSTGMQLDELVLLMRATRATHEELADLRSEITTKNWRLMLPDAKPETKVTEHFLLYGNVSPETLDDVGMTAEQQVSALERIFKAPGDKPFIRGKMTIFVFEKRYDYGEIGQMLERREIPTDWKGHWRYTVVDAYGAVLPARGGEYSLASLVGQQIAGVYVASHGKAPHWFAEGSGRAAAAKLDPKDPRVQKWDSQVGEILSHSKKPDAFMTGDLQPEEADILSYSYVKFLMGKSASYQALLDDLRGGTPFDAAFSKAYGGTPTQGATAWAAAGGGASSSKTKRAK